MDGWMDGWMDRWRKETLGMIGRRKEQACEDVWWAPGNVLKVLTAQRGGWTDGCCRVDFKRGCHGSSWVV